MSVFLSVYICVRWVRASGVNIFPTYTRQWVCVCVCGGAMIVMTVRPWGFVCWSLRSKISASLKPHDALRCAKSEMFSAFIAVKSGRYFNEKVWLIFQVKIWNEELILVVGTTASERFIFILLRPSSLNLTSSFYSVMISLANMSIRLASNVSNLYLL